MFGRKESERATSHQDECPPMVTRRALVGAGLGTMGVAGMTAVTAAQPRATPASSGAATGLDEQELLHVSGLLVGGGSLPIAALPELARLISADDALVAALPDVRRALHGHSADALKRASLDARRLAGNILSYWYLGMFDGRPIPNRAELFPHLLSWQTLPYTTVQTVCKSFGYWAMDVPVSRD